MFDVATFLFSQLLISRGGLDFVPLSSGKA